MKKIYIYIYIYRKREREHVRYLNASKLFYLVIDSNLVAGIRSRVEFPLAKDENFRSSIGSGILSRSRIYLSSSFFFFFFFFFSPLNFVSSDSQRRRVVVASSIRSRYHRVAIIRWGNYSRTKNCIFFTRLRSSSSFHALFFENSLAAGWLFATIVSALSLSLSCFLAELATLDSVQSRTHRVIDERAFDRRKKSRGAREG